MPTNVKRDKSFNFHRRAIYIEDCEEQIIYFSEVQTENSSEEHRMAEG